MIAKLIAVSGLLLLLIACNQSGLNKDVKRIYDKREELIQEFKNITVWKRGDSTFLLQKYKEDSINSYLFMGHNGLILQSKTERFRDVDTLTQNNKVRELLIKLLKEMDALDIREVSSDRMRLGIDLEFFLRNGGVVFFVRDVSTVTNPAWQQYIKEAEMIGEHWYYNAD